MARYVPPPRGAAARIGYAAVAVALLVATTVLVPNGVGDGIWTELADVARIQTKPPAEVADGWTVTNVVDGDTVDVRHTDGTEERVRIVGIDTPERGECGFGEASVAMAALVQGAAVDLAAGARDDRDRYGRILRYVDVDGVDAGLSLIEDGLAIARYDSRDGYGRHDREEAYIAADAVTPHACGAQG